MVPIVQNLVSTSKYSIKCPYAMTPSRIVVHNTANDASAANEIKYMISNTNEVSFHYAVDDKQIVQGIPVNRNTWNAGDGNGKGNREGISIEICYSLSGGSRFVAAEKNAAEFIASLLKERGWGIDKVTKHQDYNGKYCPHRTLDMGWQRFLNMVQSYMTGNTQTATQPAQTPTKPAAQNMAVNVTYRVRTQAHGWLSEVTNLADYAGWQDSPITDVVMKVSAGTIKYRVHVLGGGWLGWITGYNLNDAIKGYAGNGKPIDALEVYYYTPDNIRPYKRAKYRVAPCGRGYYDWQHDNETSGNQDGYAGSFGARIGKLQITIE